MNEDAYRTIGAITGLVIGLVLMFVLVLMFGAAGAG